MLHHRSAQIVDFVHLRFVCLKMDSLAALSSIDGRRRLLVNLRVQAFTTKVGGPVHPDGTLVVTDRQFTAHEVRADSKTAIEVFPERRWQERHYLCTRLDVPENDE